MDVLCKESESRLNLLLMDYWKNQDKTSAAIVSRTVTGAIITYGEHPMFLNRALGQPDNSGVDNNIWATLRTFILSSIKNYQPENFD
jgi:hypothetical protein